jgi:hypothetical protein
MSRLDTLASHYGVSEDSLRALMDPERRQVFFQTNPLVVERILRKNTETLLRFLANVDPPKEGISDGLGVNLGLVRFESPRWMDLFGDGDASYEADDVETYVTTESGLVLHNKPTKKGDGQRPRSYIDIVGFGPGGFSQAMRGIPQNFREGYFAVDCAIGQVINHGGQVIDHEQFDIPDPVIQFYSGDKGDYDPSAMIWCGDLASFWDPGEAALINLKAMNFGRDFFDSSKG